MTKKPKEVKTPKAKGGGKGRPLSFRDPLTGQLIASDTVINGFFTATQSPNSSYASGQYEIEANKDTIILTTRYDNWIGPNSPRPDRIDVGRVVLTGSFNTDRNGNLQGTLTRASTFGVQSGNIYTEDDFFMETAQSYTINEGTPITNNLRFTPESLASATYFYDNLDAYSYNSDGEIIGNSFDNNGRFPGTPIYSDRNSLKGLPDASFFNEGWWQDPFAPNLI